MEQAGKDVSLMFTQKQRRPGFPGLLFKLQSYFFWDFASPAGELDARAGSTATGPAIAGAGAFERMTAQASTPRRASATTQTIIAVTPVAPEYCTTIGAMMTETRFTTLIIGLSAGPAVSLN